MTPTTTKPTTTLRPRTFHRLSGIPQCRDYIVIDGREFEIIDTSFDFDCGEPCAIRLRAVWTRNKEAQP